MPTAPTTTSSYERRDQALLTHAALYRLLLPAVVKEVFFAGKEPGHVLKRLCDLGLLLAYLRSLPGKHTFYMLTPSGCLAAKAPVTRAESFQGATFDLVLGTLSFCFLGGARRHLLHSHELDSQLGGAQPNNVPFVVADERGEPCVLRLVPTAGATPQQLVRQLDELCDKLSRKPDLHRRLTGQELGFGVLVPTVEKCRAFERVLATSHVGRDVVTVVDVGATAETLATLLKSRKDN